MSCDVCKKYSKVWDYTQELLVSRMDNRKTGNPMLLLVQGRQNPQSVNIEIRYCPWCGEKLKEED